MRSRQWLFAVWLLGAIQAVHGDPRLHPGELRMIDVERAPLREVVPDAVYMRHWFGTHQSTAVFRFPPKASVDTAPALAFHSHGTELAIQLAGDSEILDAQRRRYPLRQGDVVLVKADVLHTGTFGDAENRILSVVTPPRPKYPAEDGTAYFPGHGRPVTAAAPVRTAYRGPAVRTLFNLSGVESMLMPYPGGAVAFRHWHGDDVSVAVTRLQRGRPGHQAVEHDVHGEALVWILRGRMRYTVPGAGQVTAGAGQAVVLPPYRAHSAQCVGEDCLLVSWHAPRRDEWGPEGSLPPLRLVATGGGAVDAAQSAQCPCRADARATGEPR
jgi:quercetin dioxygenase-like cupin family protein